MHQHNIENARGDLADVIPFCGDSCHREWCADNGQPYAGWNGCHESPDYVSYCAQCGVIASPGPDGCEHQRDNVIVNRFTREDGETCGHGNWIQLPAHMLPRYLKGKGRP